MNRKVFSQSNILMLVQKLIKTNLFFIFIATYNSNSNYYIPPFRIPQAPSLSSSDQQPQQYQQQSQQQFFRLPPSSSYQIQNSQPDFQPPPYLHPLVLPFSNGLPSSDRYNLNHNYSQNQRGFGGMMQPSFEFARRGKGGGGSDGRFIELEKLEDTKPLVPVVTSNSIPSTSTANSSIDIVSLKTLPFLLPIFFHILIITFPTDTTISTCPSYYISLVIQTIFTSLSRRFIPLYRSIQISL